MAPERPVLEIREADPIYLADSADTLLIRVNTSFRAACYGKHGSKVVAMPHS
ncbi:hypothetical protein HPT27_10040 [Permianibacter sp. IMCC34836]|uniref:hypothetical protein n=1 Tax=Permianibacter fluminis TaxID=2738515 RepID=UPI001556B716|nr:hypothetical protein [Permianibacter fluminis]NQD37369.1 hypothetical protein [Permianibacter fluminis]